MKRKTSTRNSHIKMLTFIYICIFSNIGIISIIDAREIDAVGSKQIILCKEMEYIDKKLDCLREIITLEDTASEEREKAFEEIFVLWKNGDGAEPYYISDVFLDILIYDYEFFFSQMKKHKAEYSNWIKELGRLSFVWFKEPPSPLEKKRKRLICYLQCIEDLEKDSDRLRVLLLNELVKIRPRQID